MSVPTHGRPPTAALLLGLLITLSTVVAYSWYVSTQITGLRRLQADLTDRNRSDSLQLLRIQNDLNQLGLAMRDMVEVGQPYPVIAWATQFDRIRQDLDAALKREAEVAIAQRTPEQRQYLATSVAQFWDAADRVFALARDGRQDEARAQVRQSLQARQSALVTLIARLLVQNNESEEQVAQQVQDIYASVQRQVRWFLAATLAAIALTGLFLIRSSRRLFAELARLSDQRRELAQQMIETREATLRELSRELHDQLGQVLTAMGSMIGRAAKQVPEASPLRTDLREIGEIAQGALENVRGLSQTLHPSILEELGLDSTIDWYLSTVQRQFGLDVTCSREGPPARVDDTTGIHVYRVLQEAIGNIARHSGTTRALVRLHSTPERLTLEVEDNGKGMPTDTSGRGLGLITMRERAALVGGSLEFLRPAAGGTLVRLTVPVGAAG